MRQSEKSKISIKFKEKIKTHNELGGWVASFLLPSFLHRKQLTTINITGESAVSCHHAELLWPDCFFSASLCFCEKQMIDSSRPRTERNHVLSIYLSVYLSFYLSVWMLWPPLYGALLPGHDGHFISMCGFGIPVGNTPT